MIKLDEADTTLMQAQSIIAMVQIALPEDANERPALEVVSDLLANVRRTLTDLAKGVKP